MDFELEQNMILCYETVGQAAVCQEETQEAIVPDACPDILRIAAVYAQAFPTRSETRAGQAIVTGMIQASVLYMPETGGLMQTIPLKIPFSTQLDMPGLTSDGMIEMAARVYRSDVRILNPRKLLLRCDLVVEATALCKKEYELCSGVLRPEQGNVCQKQMTVEHERIVAAPHRIFPLSEEIRLTGTQEPVLLSAGARSICSESRMVGSKLIFKGQLDVDLLLQTQEGDLEHRTESFPFSQILEAKTAEEGATAQVKLEVCEFSCVQPLDDPFHLMVEAEVLASGQVRECGSVQLLADLYSTTNHIQSEMQEMKFYAPCQETVIPQTIRDLMETGDVVRAVCDSRVHLGQVARMQEEKDIAVTAHGVISVLYLDEDRQPRCLEKNVELCARIPCVDGAELLCVTLCPGELYTAPCAGGIEVRFTAEFHAVTACPTQVGSIKYAALGEAREQNGARPSVILRQAEPGESLWDIAKACVTTSERIMQANELTGEELPAGTMLLIPGVR